ncbi:MAG: TIGR00730 family Rossman fold protein [Candidatus Nanopelagicales bacterium]
MRIVPRSVCVFCSSSDLIAPRYLTLADDVGAALGSRGWTCVSGGGSVSMMGRLARAARAAGGHTVGVIPEALRGREVADLDADELVVTQNMRERKGVMDERSDAFLALPGGIGTLEELMEVWTAGALAMHDKPVVALDPWGDFTLLRAQVDAWIDGGFVSRDSLSRVRWVATVDQAIDALTAPVLPSADSVME